MKARGVMVAVGRPLRPDQRTEKGCVLAGQRLGFRDAVGWLAQIIGPDSAYVRLGIVYTIAISLLALATPISVQLLINSVANTAMPAPLWALSGVLLMLLLMVAGLSALRVWIMAAFERRLF